MQEGNHKKRSLHVTDLQHGLTYAKPNVIVDLVDDFTGENEATVSIHMRRDCMEVRVSGFLVATFPMGSHEELEP